MSGELQQWKALRSAVAAADTAIDLTGASRNEADFGDKPALARNLCTGSIFGRADLNDLALELIFYGLGSNNDSNVVTLYSWRENGPCEIICVLTLTTGQLLAQTDPADINAALGTGSNYRFVDTIVMTTNHANVAYEIMDSGNDRIAKVRVPLDGRRWWYAEVTTLNSTNLTVATSLVSKCASTTMVNPSFDIGDVNLLNTSGTPINPATEDKQDDIIAAVNSGLPTYGLDAAAETDDSYATVVTAPARECHFLHVAVESFGAIISLDGGTTDHFRIPANTERGFSGLTIPSGAVIQGKNAVATEDYTNLAISVW